LSGAAQDAVALVGKAHREIALFDRLQRVDEALDLFFAPFGEQIPFGGASPRGPRRVGVPVLRWGGAARRAGRVAIARRGGLALRRRGQLVGAGGGFSSATVPR